MKTNYLNHQRIILFVFTLFLTACDQEVIETPKPIDAFGVEFKDGILHFASEEAYAALVESQSSQDRADFMAFLNQRNGYTSLRKAYTTNGRSSAARTFSTAEQEIVDSNDLLSSILNEDGLVSIGDYYFKVNLATETVYALETRFENEIGDLNHENEMNRNIMIFSTDDDVLDLLASGSKGTSNGRTKLFCGESGARGKKDDGFDASPFDENYRHDNKIVYQKAGVYFSLQAKTKVQYKGWTGLWGDGGPVYDQRISYYVKYEPKCKGVTEKSGIKEDDGSSNELNYRPYESTRGLHKYRYEASYFGAGYWSREYVIADGF